MKTDALDGKKIEERPTGRRINLVLCHYYLSVSELKRVLSMFARYTQFQIAVVVVSNGDLSAETVTDGKGTAAFFLKGSNFLYDFSAYREGLQHVRSTSGRAGTFFVNDSLFRKYPYRWIIRKIFADISCYPELLTPVAIGFSGTYGFYLNSNPWSGSPRHLCTACFYLNAPAADLFLELTESALAVASSAVALNSGPELDSYLRQVLGDKFFGYLSLLHFAPGIGVWAPEHLADCDSSAMVKKAICFYLEHRFSGEVENSGGGTIFINRGKSALTFRTLLAGCRLFPLRIR